jgi:hypothetical protein
VGHKVTFKAGKFMGVGKVVGSGADGCTVADETGREHAVHWHEVTANHSEPDGDEKGKKGKK